MRIAIIDDGIDQNCNIYNKDIYYFSIRNGRFEECKKQGEYAILSHGTIASLIFTYFTQKMDYELYSLKIVDVNTQTATIEYLISAIQWCIQEKIDMILMSLGSTEYSDFEGLQKVLRIAAANESFGYNEDEIVSSDVIGMRFGSLFDATQTMVNKVSDDQYEVQVVSWYDNENSYTSQMVRTIKYFSELA